MKQKTLLKAVVASDAVEETPIGFTFFLTYRMNAATPVLKGRGGPLAVRCLPRKLGDLIPCGSQEP